MKKRILSMFMALAIIFTLIPTVAFAEENNIVQARTETEFYEALRHSDYIKVVDSFAIKSPLTLTDIHLELAKNVTLTIEQQITFVGSLEIKGSADDTSVIKRTTTSGNIDCNDVDECKFSNIVFDGGADWCGEPNQYIGRGMTNQGILASEPMLNFTSNSIPLTLTWNYVTVRNCATTRNGGNLYFRRNAANATFNFCNFNNNASGDENNNGSAGCIWVTVFNNWGAYTFNSCNFEGNASIGTYSTNAWWHGGSCIRMQNDNAYLNNCTFKNNGAFGTNYGGALYAFYGTFTANNCSFEKNVAPHGGAVRITETGRNCSFKKCTFTENVSNGSAAAASIPQRTVVFDECEFSGNRGSTTNVGTTNTLWGSNCTVNNCTFKENYNAAEKPSAHFNGYMLSGNAVFEDNSAGSSNEKFGIYYDGTNEIFKIKGAMTQTTPVKVMASDTGTFAIGSNYAITAADVAKYECVSDTYELYLDVAANEIKVKEKGVAITPTELPVYSTNYTGTYNGNAHTFLFNTVEGATVKYTYTDEDGTFVTDVATKPSFTKAGTYTVDYTVSATGYSDKTGSVTVTINKKKITVPTGATLVENGTVQTGVAEGADYTLTNYKGKEVKDYIATAVLNDTTNTQWSDNTTADKSITWKINPAPTPKTDVILSFEKGTEDQSTTVEATSSYSNAASGAPDGATITYSSSKTNVATVDASGVVTPIKNGIVVITAKYAGDATYNSAKISYVLKIDSNFETDHSLVDESKKDATCEENGNIEGKVCKVCGHAFAGYSVVPALGHKYNVYTAKGNVITGTCKNDTSHKITATLNAPSTMNGEATITYSEKWPEDAQNLTITYNGNEIAKTASVTYEGVTASVSYISADTDGNDVADACVQAEDNDGDGIYTDGTNIYLPVYKDGDDVVDFYVKATTNEDGSVTDGTNTYIPVDTNNDGEADVYVKASNAGNGIYKDAEGKTYIAVDTDNDDAVNAYVKATDDDGDGIYMDENGNRFVDSNNDKIYTPYTSTPSGGGSSSSSKKPAVVVTNPTGGSATASNNGTVTITPNKGYEIDKVTVNGKEVDVPENGKLTGLKPTDKVNVTFKAGAAGEKHGFVDVADTDYYAKAVDWAAANGITGGVDATHFGPNMGCTRAHMVTFLWRAVGCPEPKGDASVFVDVVVNSYYEKAVAWGIENGIVKGTSKTTFSPDMIVTRGQAVTFLARMAGIDGEADGYNHSFTDVYAKDYYNNAVSWAATEGITSGTSESTFSPVDNCLRCQIVTFLYRYFVK